MAKNYWNEPWTLERAKRSEQWIKSDFLHVMHEIRCIWGKSKGEPAGKKKMQKLHSLVSHYIEEYEQYFRFLFHTEDEVEVLTVRLQLRGLMGVDSCFGGILELVPDIESYFSNGYNRNSIWHVCLFALAHHDDWSQMLECWRKVRDGGEVPVPDWGLKMERNAKGVLTPESSRYLYSFLHDRPEFDLFIHIINRYTPESSTKDSYLESRDLATYAEAICLYIALRNELNKLKEEAEHYRIPLEKEAKQQVDEGEWRKGWIDLCFTEAEKDEWIKHISVNEYEWTFGKPKNASLAYFIKNMMDPDDRMTQTEWGPWEKRFGITNLSQSAAQVKPQKWTTTIDLFFDKLKAPRDKD